MQAVYAMQPESLQFREALSCYESEKHWLQGLALDTPFRGGWLASPIRERSNLRLAGRMDHICRRWIDKPPI